MIKFLKNLFKKLFNKKEEVVEPTPQSKPEHCVNHTAFKKTCPVWQEVVK